MREYLLTVSRKLSLLTVLKTKCNYIEKPNILSRSIFGLFGAVNIINFAYYELRTID